MKLNKTNWKSNVGRIFALLTIGICICCLVCFFNKAFAEEQYTEETYTIKGQVTDYVTNLPIDHAFVSGNFSVDGVPAYTDDVYTDSSGYYEIYGVAKNSIGAIAFSLGDRETTDYLGNKMYVDNPVVSNIENNNIKLSPIITNISGKIVDQDNIDAGGVYVEFHNPKSLASPDADVRVYTDPDGTFDVTKNRSSLGEKFYKGIGVGQTYYVTVTSIPSSASWPDPTQYPTSFKSVTVEKEFGVEGTNSLNFKMENLTTALISDPDQEPSHWTHFEFKRFANGNLIAGPSWYDDTNITPPVGTEISVAEDLSIVAKYSVDGVNYEERMRPEVTWGIDWEVTKPDFTKKPVYWEFTSKNDSGIYETFPIHRGFRLVIDNNTGAIKFAAKCCDCVPVQITTSPVDLVKSFHHDTNFDGVCNSYDSSSLKEKICVGSKVSIKNGSLVIKYENNGCLEDISISPNLSNAYTKAVWKYNGQEITKDDLINVEKADSFNVDLVNFDPSNPDNPHDNNINNVDGALAQTQDNLSVIVGIFVVLTIMSLLVIKKYARK